jgi:hypothetical protein
VIGREFKGNAELIYRSLTDNGFEPKFILYAFPTYKRIASNYDWNWYFRYPAAIVFQILPATLIKVIFKNYFPKFGKKCFFVKDINSISALKILVRENPEYIILYSCGYIKKRTCELFHNKMISAHAGKLPEYRGISNVEWAYLENDDLYATFQFTAPSMDTGDIVFEKILNKNYNAASIAKLRDEAFTQTFRLFPEALRCINECGFKPVKQSINRTTRYKMHHFLLKVLENKLRSYSDLRTTQPSNK